MTKTAALTRAPEQEAKASPVDRARASLAAARAAARAAREKAEQLSARLAELGEQLETHRGVLQAAGDQLAAEPGATSSQAFEAATATAASLEAQQAALRDRLIPTALDEARTVATSAEAARVAYNHALFRSRVRDMLIPADRRWQAALTELAAALDECKAVRRELVADPDFAAFHVQDLGSGARRHLLQTSTLDVAVPFGLSEYFYTYAQADRTNTRQTLIPDLALRHVEAFGLGEEA